MQPAVTFVWVTISAMDSSSSVDDRLPFAEVYFVDRWHRGAVVHTAETEIGWMAWVRFRQGNGLVLRRFAEADIHLYDDETVDPAEL